TLGGFARFTWSRVMTGTRSRSISSLARTGADDSLLPPVAIAQGILASVNAVRSSLGSGIVHLDRESVRAASPLRDCRAGVRSSLDIGEASAPHVAPPTPDVKSAFGRSET